METIIIFSGILAALACGWLALGGMISGPGRKIRARATKIGRKISQAGRGAVVSQGTASVKKETRNPLPAFEKLAGRLLPRRQMLRDRLARTGRDIPIGIYVLINIGLVTGVAVAATLAQLPPALALAMAAVGGIGLPHMVVGRMAAKRLAAFTAIFPDAIDLIVRGLRAGLPVTESIAAVGCEMADPVGREFRQIADAVTLGRQLEEALWDTAKRLDTAEFKFFVISLSVQRETGGNLGETLANLSGILRSRKQMKLKIKAMSSEARASAMILGSLPFIMFGIIYFLNPGYETELFTDPRGRVMLGAALLTMGMGIAVMAKMVRFEI